MTDIGERIKRSFREYENRKARAYQDNYRWALIKSDGSCAVCGIDASGLLIVHHKLPVSEGGRTEIDNLILLCHNCHLIAHKVRRTKQKHPDIFGGMRFMRGGYKHLSDEQLARLLEIATYGLP